MATIYLWVFHQHKHNTKAESWKWLQWLWWWKDQFVDYSPHVRKFIQRNTLTQTLKYTLTSFQNRAWQWPHTNSNVSGLTTAFKCGSETRKLSFCVCRTRLSPETAMTDTMVNIATIWHLECLVSAILTNVILQRQKTCYVQQF